MQLTGIAVISFKSLFRRNSSFGLAFILKVSLSFDLQWFYFFLFQFIEIMKGQAEDEGKSVKETQEEGTMED